MSIRFKALGLVVLTLSQLVFVSSVVVAQGGPGSLTAELAGPGAGPGGTVIAGQPFQFNIILQNLPDFSIKGLSNGFRVYSPGTASWEPIVCDSFSHGWPGRFDFMPFNVSYHGVTGSGADSLVVGAVASNGPGFEPGFTNEVWYISTRVQSEDAGELICLDSSFCPPNATWMWSNPDGPYLPAWGGPYCYEITYNQTWNPGDAYKMHFPQLPDEDGWDCDMAWWPARIALADDWQCSETGWVKSIHWWGSWWQGVDGILDTLHMAICKDTMGAWGVPQPGRVLWEVALSDVQAILMPQQDSQNWFQPSSGNSFNFQDQAYYQIDVFLDETNWFWQEEGTVYWLAISTRAADVYGTYLGWRSSGDHWREPAVWGQNFDDWYPSPPLAEPPDWLVQLDMAFVVTDTIGSVYEPQLPDEDGWDCDMAWWPARIALADDWQCSASEWVKSIRWWGAWWQGVEGVLDTLHMAILKDTMGVWDVPQPGRVLWEVALTDVQATPMPQPDSQNWFQPSTGYSTTFEDQAYYQFDVSLDETDWFWQEEGTIYWLALSTRAADIYGTYLGWRSSSIHWREPAVWGQNFEDWYPDPPLAEPPDWLVQLDMAFAVNDTSSFSCCMPPIRGNVDYDSGDVIDISDLVYLVDYMFSGGPEPVCIPEADMDASGEIDISDLVYLVDYMFTSGPDPLPCS